MKTALEILDTITAAALLASLALALHLAMQLAAPRRRK